MTEKEILIDMRELIDDLKKKVNNNQSVTLKGEGASMLPFITTEDTLTLTKPPKRTKTGEIYLYRRSDGSYAIHRVYAVRKDLVFMLGDAQFFIEKIHKSDLVAIVTTIKKPDDLVDCTDVWQIIRSVFRMKSRIFKAKFKFLFMRFIRKAKGLLKK